jgi:hypothetical protein
VSSATAEPIPLAAPARSRALRLGVSLAVVAWWLCIGFAFAPGGTSPDVFLQYEEGLRGEYSNLHPPLLSFFYGVASRGFGTPAPVFWVQTALYFGLATWLALRARRRRWLALVLLALCLTLPPSWAIAATLWKDVWFDLALLIAALGLTLPRSRLRLGLLIAAAILATLVRYNALPFGIGLVAWGAWTHFRTGWRRMGAACGLAALVAVSPRVLDAALDVEEQWSYGSILVYDVVGVYVREPAAFAASPLAARFPFATLRDAYVPSAGWRIFGEFGIPGLRFYELSPLREALTAEWRRLVLEHPGAYLRHRSMVFSRLLGLNMPQQLSLYGETATRGLFPGPDTTRPLHRGLDAWRKAWANDFPFKAWFWALALAAAMAIAARARNADAVVFGALIAGTYSLYFFAAASAEFRYAHPLLIGAFAVIWIVSAGAAGQRVMRDGTPKRRWPT